MTFLMVWPVSPSLSFSCRLLWPAQLGLILKRERGHEEREDMFCMVFGSNDTHEHTETHLDR